MSLLEKYAKPREKTDKVSLSVKVPKTLNRDLEQVASRTGYSKSEVVVDLIQDGLCRLADALHEGGVEGEPEGAGEGGEGESE